MLTYFSPMFHLHTPWKLQTFLEHIEKDHLTKMDEGFLTFSGDVEMEH